MGRFKKIFLISILLIFFAAPLAMAETPCCTIPSAEESKEYSLTLEDVSRLALQNNFEIQLAKYDTYISRTQGQISKSIYDAVISAEAKYRDDQSARTSSLAGTKNLDHDYSLGFSKKLPMGTTIGLDLTNSRKWSNSPFATLNPSHDAMAALSLKQELGRNFFGIQDRSSIKLADLDIQNSQFLSLEKIETDLVSVQKAYWDLVLHLEWVAIQKDMLKQAQRLLQFNEERFQDGVIEQSDVLAAQANYHERANALILAEDEMRSKENLLRLLLNISDEQIQLVPRESLLIPDEIAKLALSLQSAFEHRYDYQRLKKVINSKDIKLVMKKASLWPEINLSASMARNGVAGHFDKASENILEEDNPDFSAGLEVNFFLENNKAQGEWKAAQLEKARALIALKQLERKITIGIVDQVRRCNVLKEVAQNAQSVAEIQQQKLQAEEQRFASGRSDTDTIVRFQNDVGQSRFSASQAKYRYQEALIELRRAEGVLLSAYWDEKL